MSQQLIVGAACGLGATLVMDLGAVLGTRLGILVKPDVRRLGRWMRVPDPLAERMGFLAHYTIGAVLGLVAIALFGEWTGISRGLALVGFGVGTSILPWFFMFPSMGFGVFGLRAPAEAKLFRTSLIGHFNYGWGLALADAIVSSS